MRQISAKVAAVRAKVERRVGIHSMGFNSTPVVRKMSSTKKYKAKLWMENSSMELRPQNCQNLENTLPEKVGWAAMRAARSSAAMPENAAPK